MDSKQITTPVILAVIGFAAICVGCVTALVAFGRDPATLVGFIAILIPQTIGFVVLSHRVESVRGDTENIRHAVNGKLSKQLSDQTDEITRRVTGETGGAQ